MQKHKHSPIFTVAVNLSLCCNYINISNFRDVCPSYAIKLSHLFTERRGRRSLQFDKNNGVSKPTPLFFVIIFRYLKTFPTVCDGVTPSFCSKYAFSISATQVTVLEDFVFSIATAIAI